MYPVDLYRGGRPRVDVFEPSEALYRRCDREEYESIRQGSGIGFRAPAFSVNRGRFSRPEWVLLPNHPDCGILQFLVRDVPREVMRPPSSPYSYGCGVEHVPEDCNYSHSEVRWYRDGQYSENLDVPKTVKKQVRQYLVERLGILRRPTMI